MAENIDDLHRQIKELEGKVAYLNAQLKQENRFGLQWIDVPEAFDAESENKIPILEEVPELAITNDDGKPTHILIEGDNYHALTCLNYTHHGKVDVIYIDPPYNTGSDGFTYKDKRFLDKFPDGTTLKASHPLRHSAWLSFMNKRLELAKGLLKPNGVMFISIDENEYANLKLLCEKVFPGGNVTELVWQKRKGGGNDSKYVATDHEYILIYRKKAKDDNDMKWRIPYAPEYLKRYKFQDEIGLFYFDTLSRPGLNNPIIYDVECPDGSIIKDGTWQISENTFLAEKERGDVVFVKNDEGGYTVMHKIRMPEGKVFRSIINNVTNKDAADEMLAYLGHKKMFSNPKPTGLITQLLQMPFSSRDLVVVDFFAGSGTTLHACEILNENDGGTRKCILVQSADKTYTFDNIGNKKAVKGCEAAFDKGFDNIAEITYKRIANTIDGCDGEYENEEVLYRWKISASNIKNAKSKIEDLDIAKRIYENSFEQLITTVEDNCLILKGVTTKKQKVPPLGNSLKYYRTSFVGSNASSQATDEDKTILAQKAGCLLALAENTLYEQKTTDNYQIFKDKDKDVWTAVYFKEDVRPKFFNEFVESVKDLKGTKNVYIFSWGDVGSFESYFDDDSHAHIKGIPQPILDIYKSLNS